MTTYIVTYRPEYTLTNAGGAVFEMHHSLLQRSPENISIKEYLTCHTPKLLQELVERKTPFKELTFRSSFLSGVLDSLWSGNDDESWFDRQPDIHIYQDETGQFVAKVSILKDYDPEAE